MSLFVLVHGGWGGGWQWRSVANRLRAYGHEVYAPTLSGLGDRSGAAEDPANLGLSRHIDDVVKLFEFDDLQEAVLVGWSYGSAVVDGVADRVPGRISRVINLDGGLVEDGRSLMQIAVDQAPDQIAFFDSGKETGWIAPPTAEQLAGALSDPRLCRWVAERERPHPLASYTEPYPDNGARRHSLPHVFVRCTIDEAPEDAAVTRLRSAPDWTFVELPLNHLGLPYDPDKVATTLRAVS
jgi:pimeloyl-ACP methyl ester carboxylesterase